MEWTDRVYGEATIDDPEVLALIACPTFQRLKGIKQAGPSAFAYPFKTVTRFEHSLGVYLLLRRLGAGVREQIAGLLHDISHTAFSHAVDFIISSEEQDHHEKLKPMFLDRPDVVRALERSRLRAARLLRRLDLSAARTSPPLALRRSTRLLPPRRPRVWRGQSLGGRPYPRPRGGRRPTIVVTDLATVARDGRTLPGDESRLVGECLGVLHLQRIRRRSSRGLSHRRVAADGSLRGRRPRVAMPARCAERGDRREAGTHHPLHTRTARRLRADGHSEDALDRSAGATGREGQAAFGVVSRGAARRGSGGLRSRHGANKGTVNREHRRTKIKARNLEHASSLSSFFLVFLVLDPHADFSTVGISPGAVSTAGSSRRRAM